jgi:hypothetical protein
MNRFVPGLFALAILLAGCGDFISTSPEHPLGELAEIEAYLVGERGFQKSTDKMSIGACFQDRDLWERYQGMKVYKYKDTGKGTAAGDIYIKVAVDESGKVVAVEGRFFSQRAIWSDAGGRAETFAAKLWKEVSGTEATFREEMIPGPQLETYLLSEFAKGPVVGRWEKQPTSGEAKHTNTLWDQVLLHVR